MYLYWNISDQKLLAKEIKDTHEAFLMAKKYYKKYLKIYFTVEARQDGKQEIFLQFFTEVKKESKEYSVQLLKDTGTKRYEGMGILTIPLFMTIFCTISVKNRIFRPWNSKNNQISHSISIFYLDV